MDFSWLGKQDNKPFSFAPTPATRGPTVERAAQMQHQPTGIIPQIQAGGQTMLTAAQDLFGHMTEGLFPHAAAPTGGQTAGQTGGTPAQAGAQPHHRPTRDEYKSGVDKHLDAEILANRNTRAGLDKARKGNPNAPGTHETAVQLDADREHLLGELKERSGVYNESIHEINEKLGPGKLPKNLTPEQKALIAQRTQLETEKNKYSDQQTALQRWHDRGQINSINEQLKNPNLAPADRTKLLAEKKTLATGLLSTTKSYQQFDERWGDTVYGKDKSYTTMTEAGCGPTALAMMMDFRDHKVTGGFLDGKRPQKGRSERCRNVWQG